MSAEDFCRSHLKVAIAQICQNLGWNSTTTLSLELLMDVTERYIEDLAKTTHRFSEQFGRTVPNLDDLGLAFRLKSISIGELEEYVRHVEPMPFGQETISFPARKANNLQFPNPNSREILHHRDEHIHEHLPPMFPNMKEEVGEQQGTSASSQTTKNEVQENVPSDTAAPGTTGEKRPVPDPLTPGKRPRVTASSLPEEAGHSQYEMSSVIMAPDGTILGLRGRGKLPEACPPPPTIRISTSGLDTTSGPNRGLEGSDRNKENTAVALPAKESSVRKEGPSAVKGSSDSKSKSDIPKSKSKKKDKSVADEKGKKQKKKDKEPDKKLKKTAGEKRPASVSLESGLTPPAKKPKLKDSKVTTEKKSKAKSPKGQAVRKKTEPKKKATPKPKGTSSSTCTVGSEGGSESCLKDLLLSTDKLTPVARSKHALSAASEAHKRDLLSVASPESDLLLRQAFPPTDIFDNESCETSPQRLIIAEAEGRAQEKEEERRIRLKNIDDTISSVIKDSAAKSGNKKAETQAASVNKPVALANPTETPRKRGRPKKMKIKSSQFIDDDVMKQEKEDDMGVRSIKSINDTIEAVIRQGSEEPKPSSSTPVGVETSTAPASASIPTAPDVPQTPVKEGKKKKANKDKAPGVKKKLKAKLQNKTEKDGESAPPQPSQTAVDLKPFVSDKFSNAEMKVFEFGDAESPPPIPERRPSQAEKEPSSKEPSPMPVATTPVSAPDNFSPTDVKPIIKSPTPETAIAAASSASPSSATSVDQQLVMPLKIEIPKDKERHKEKSRDKDHHRKDKKEKRRDKEKKKKNKDKDRDRDRERHDKHHHEHKHEKSKVKEETPPLGITSLKLKIKFGNKDSSSSPSVVVTDNKSQVDLSMQPSPTPRRESLKLVIRQDAAAEGPRSQKKYSSVVSTQALKAEPRNTPPTLHPASPLPGTPPPPVLSRNNSPVRKRSPSPPPRSPPAPRPDVERGRSPVHKSPPHPQVFAFTSPQSSPLRSRPSLTPPPRTPSTSPKSPSSMPRTPSPKQHCYPNSPFSFSSPIHTSPVRGKSPTPTPKTPSLSPAYHISSPLQTDHSPVRQEKSPPPVRTLFSTPEHDTAPSSPVVPAAPPVEEKPEVQTEPTPSPVVPKPKGKVGRPRLKSPRTTSPKGKSPKSPKRAGKTPKAVKTNATGKSAGRGRPPKAKTLALRASLAAASAEGELPSVKPKAKSLTPPPPEVEKVPVQKTPGASSPSIEVEKSGLDSSSESPSPSHLSIAFTSGSSSRQRGGTVETETVGSYVDSTGATIWICPACKMQDDGSPMIGCDKCDDWYHWVCVNITTEPPEEESWFCPRCSAKAKQQVKPKAKRGRKKKVH